MGELTRSFDTATSNDLKKGTSWPGLCGAHYEIENSDGTETEKTSVASVTGGFAVESDNAASIAVSLGAIAFGMTALAF